MKWGGLAPPHEVYARILRRCVKCRAYLWLERVIKTRDDVTGTYFLCRECYEQLVIEDIAR